MTDDRLTVTVTHIFTFGDCVPARKGEPVEHVLDLGRYGLHSAADKHLGLQILPSDGLPAGRVAVAGAPVLGDAPVKADLWTDGHGLAQVHVRVTSVGSFSEVARDLALLCHQRHTLTLDGRSLVEWVEDTWDCTSRPTLLQDVLQVVELDPAVSTEIHREQDASGYCQGLLRLLYRSPDETFTGSPSSIRYPAELNRNDGDVGAHGRGVCVLGGHGPAQVEALRLVACRLLFGLARLREVRQQVEEKLLHARANEQNDDGWSDEAYLRELMASVREQRVALTFGVRAWVDGLFLPDLVLDDFRRSLSTSLRVDEIEASTTSMLTVLSDVSESSLQQAQLDGSRRVEDRQRLFQFVVSVATGITVPLALMLSYLGVSSTATVRPDIPIFDLGTYAAAWSVTVLVIVLVVVVSTLRFFDGRGGRAQTPSTTATARRAGAG